MKHKKQYGFTLIELLIAVTIVGILAAIAYPSYMNSIKKGRRSDAQSALLGLTNAMERYYIQNNSFLGAAGTAVSPADNGAPRIYASESPVDGNNKFYDLSILAATATSYTVIATPKNSQAGDGRLEINSLGEKTWYANDDGTGATKDW